MRTGRLQAIWIKRCKGGPMDPVPTAELVAQRGLKNNADQGGKRQVTIIEAEVWSALMQQLGGNLPPWARRANLLVEGVSLQNSRGKILRLGSCRIHLQGETRPCEQMEAALPGLQQAMAAPWAGGAFGVVLVDGQISVGDDVVLESAAEAGTGTP